MKPRALPRIFAVVVLAAACEPAGTTGTRAPTQAPEKTPATAAGPAACPVGPASPLVLQLGAVKGSAIAQAMQLGIAVVAFDCKEIVLLDSCSIEGRYDFVAAPRTEVDRRFASRSETEAATRLWGTSTPPLRIEPGEVLALRLVTVGQERASVSTAAKQDLQGDCARATHFVRAVHVGAFELTGTRGTVNHEAKAGRLQACPAKSSQRPPPECGAPLQLELKPIGP